MRSNLVVTGVVVAVLSLLFVLPAPLWTRVEGVTWPQKESQVRAKADGFIVELLVPDRSQVQQGQAIILTQDPLALARVKTLETRLKQLNIQLTVALTIDRVEAGIIQEELNLINSDLSRARERFESLLIRSPRDGVLIVPQSQDLPGRYLQQGESVAFVISPTEPVRVRAVVSQDHIGLVREKVLKVDVISTSYNATSFVAEMLREIHGGSNQLPTAALGDIGGGEFIVSREDKHGRTTMERVFEVELILPDEARSEFMGSRVYVRFDHGFEPLGLQAWRSLRQLFLRRFGV